jgi:hypothetical protein
MPGSQLRRSLAVAEKDIRIYYLKGPVLIFGIIFPMFLFLAFSVGRSIPAAKGEAEYSPKAPNGCVHNPCMR